MEVCLSFVCLFIYKNNSFKLKAIAEELQPESHWSYNYRCRVNQNIKKHVKLDHRIAIDQMQNVNSTDTKIRRKKKKKKKENSPMLKQT